MEKGLNREWKERVDHTSAVVLPVEPVKRDPGTKEGRMAEAVRKVVDVVQHFDVDDRAIVFDCVDRIFQRSDADSTAVIGKQLEEKRRLQWFQR